MYLRSQMLVIACLSLSMQACGQYKDLATEHVTKEGSATSKASAFSIFDDQASSLFDLSNEVEELATGFIWTEGPLWLKSQNCLLFSDIPNSKVMRYCPGIVDGSGSANEGVDTYLSDSGFANGLILDHNGDLILMQSRSRRVAKMDASLNQPEPRYTTLASDYKGKKLNSPNDVSINANGDLYFTDPPYGLPEQLDDPSKELDFQGVYRLNVNGDLTLLDSQLKYPNGVLLVDNDTKLIVAVSDPDNPSWYIYDVDTNGLLENRREFASALDYKFKRGTDGLPDGLKQHRNGTVFATGPGGVWVFTTTGKLLAHLQIEGPVANLAFDESQDYVYLTSQDRLLRVKLN